MKGGLLSGMKIINEEKTKAEISTCEKKLMNILEIQISNEVRHNEIKKKAMRLELRFRISLQKLL